MPTVLITGAAGAIGGALAHAFDAAGWRLILFDRPHSEDDLRATYPYADVRAADLTDEADTTAAVKAALEASDTIDAVLNIVGGFAMEDAAEATEAGRAKMFALNFTTLFNVTRAVLPAMQKAGSGFILGVSAEAGEEGGAGMALYAASKAAVGAYLRSLHDELRADGIRVSVLIPMGAVDTPSNRAAMPDADPNDWLAPSELAATVLHAATRSLRGHLRDLVVTAG